MFSALEIRTLHRRLTVAVVDLSQWRNPERRYNEFRVVVVKQKPQVWRGHQKELPLEPYDPMDRWQVGAYES